MGEFDEDGINLTADEEAVYVLWLASRHLESSEWLEWEDIPYIGEYAYERLVKAADELALDLARQARLLAQRTDIDPALIHERATTGVRPR